MRPCPDIRWKFRSASGFGLRVLGCVAMLMLGGCGSAPLATFDLSAPRVDTKTRALKGILSVTEPSAPAPADSDRIVVRTGSTSLAVVTGAQWTERLPRLLQTRLIQTFENAKGMKNIARPGDGAVPDHVLVWDLRRFELDALDHQARVEISVRLLDPAGKIVAAQIFAADVPGDADEAGAAVQALDAASNNVLQQIVIWAAGRV